MKLLRGSDDEQLAHFHLFGYEQFIIMADHKATRRFPFESWIFFPKIASQTTADYGVQIIMGWCFWIFHISPRASEYNSNSKPFGGNKTSIKPALRYLMISGSSWTNCGIYFFIFFCQKPPPYIWEHKNFR